MWLRQLWIVLIMALLVACSENESERTTSNVLRVAVLPDQSEIQLRKKYQPLLDHLKDHAGLNAELLIPASYNELLQWFDNKQIDMALFGVATYVKAYLKSKAVPLVMRDVDGSFRSVALTHINNPANSFKELKGASLAFGSRLSTSGHLMPRYHFQQQQIIAESFFGKVEYSGAHDLTAEWVRDGKVDLGVANSGIVNEMFLDGRLSRDKVKIIWQSEPFADYVWAIQADIGKHQKILIRDAFLHMNHNSDDKELLMSLGANYYIPAGHSDFVNLEDVIVQMEQSEKK